MSSLSLQRDHILQAAQRDKTRIALTPVEVAELDRRLADAWGIRFIANGNSIAELLAHVSDKAAAGRFIEAHDKASIALASRSSQPALASEKALFDAIAHPEIFSLVTSTRRHLILDSIAVAVGLVRCLGLEGAILDIGCHAGFVGSLLAEFLRRRITGIDPSPAAITFGRSHPARSPMLELVEAAIPWDTNARFDLAVAIDAMPQQRAQVGPYLRGLSRLLNPAGIALVVSSYWADADVEVTRRQLKYAGLGFGYADVVGGYGGIPPRFETTGFLVLMKGSSRKLPRKIRGLIESEWHRFRDYANAPATARNEKTQSYERAKRRSHGTACSDRS